MRTKGPVETEALKKRAVDTLTKRMLSAGLLEEKLTAWGGTREQAGEVTAWAAAIGLIDDGEYARALVRHYQAKGYGLYKIKDELYRRKVPREHWDQALEEMDEPDESLRRFLEKKLTDPTDPKQVKKASDALVRRGFSWNQIAQAIEGFCREVE